MRRFLLLGAAAAFVLAVVGAWLDALALVAVLALFDRVERRS